MFNTPITGNSELDAYLAQLALETDANNGVLVDSNTGKIYDGNTGNILYYLYQYIQVKYAAQTKEETSLSSKRMRSRCIRIASFIRTVKLIFNSARLLPSASVLGWQYPHHPARR